MAIQKDNSITQDYTRIRPGIRSDIQFIDNDGYLIQIPYNELKRFRIPLNKRILISKQPGATSSGDRCYDTDDTGAMGCPM
jgi:hypothetical protein